MKKLDIRLHIDEQGGPLVGQLAEVDRRVYFEYDAEFLESGLWLSPFKLPLEPGLKEHTDRSFGPLFGLFDDCLPDGWGLLLMDRHFRQEGLAPESVSPLDRLAYLGSRTMGALTYHPPSHGDTEAPPLLDLHALASHSYDVLAGETEEVLPQLQRAGGSPGGARPKVLVGLKGNELISGEEILPPEYEGWLIKFHSSRDSESDGRIEYAYSEMAAAAGIQMPATRLFHTKEGEAFFGVSRFDRQGNRRFHVHTFGNMIHANFRIPSCDYEMLMKVTRILTKNHQEVLKAFRLMVFNVFAHNRDDHVKNFAFMIDDAREWRCTPAYDLTFAHGPGGEHTTTVAGEGRAPGPGHLMQVAKSADISTADAEAIIDDVRNAVAKWPEFADKAGVARKHADPITKVLKFR